MAELVPVESQTTSALVGEICVTSRHDLKGLCYIMQRPRLGSYSAERTVTAAVSSIDCTNLRSIDSRELT